MGIVIANYLGLFLAFVLPTVGFQMLGLPSIGTSLVAFVSIGATLLVAASLARMTPAPTSPEVMRHVRNQKGILWTFVLGGLLGSFQVFLFYEQFRLRFDLGVPLHIATAILWLLAALFIVSGLASALASRSARGGTNSP